MRMKYFEDIEVGEVWDLGQRAVEAAEIIEFASQYDPQPFHTDAAAAEASFFGGLIASGWHTCAMFMRMACDAQNDEGGGERMASLGSPGFDDLKWLLPVRPGDILSVRTRILSATPSRSKQDRGTMRIQIWVSNQKNEIVLEMTSMGRYLRRPTG